MKPFLIPTFLALIVSQASSQTTGQDQSLIPSNLPSCAQTCANLLQAQTACTAPPNPAPGGTYGVQCFCGFAPLTSLDATAPANLCAGCSTNDNAAIQAWYQGTCRNGGTSGATADGQTTTSAATKGPTSSATAAPKATNSGTMVNGHPANAPNVAQKDWMSTHWQWVLMLIILVLGFIGIAVGGVYLRRYFHRRREARDARLAGPRQDLETWGPGQSVHDFSTHEIAAVSPVNEKEKERETVQATEANSDQSNNRRLKKSWLSGG
ncbi:MAG: hypothetical protein L6R37_003199 [Teloschistes peruensis]|nr:MAG: hypothetical protein L6R37_003199 [Teloschistes peruensis]